MTGAEGRHGGAALSQYPGRPADTGMGRATPTGRLPHGGEGMRERSGLRLWVVPGVWLLFGRRGSLTWRRAVLVLPLRVALALRHGDAAYDAHRTLARAPSAPFLTGKGR